ncbi:MAG: hypothetical protein HY924_01825 [Elusimicrobia bacterium]|nr:hypothetical protein [Elusimicrobiota bacterium]
MQSPFAQEIKKPQLVQQEEDDWLNDVHNSAEEIVDLNTKIENPATSPEDKAKYEAAQEAEVSKIETIGQKRPENFKAQLEVGKALVKVEEPGRAMPFVDQAVALSQGKPKRESAARTLRGTILQGQGDLPGAARECGRAVELDPANKGAYSCYQLTKDRVATKRGGTAPGGSQARPDEAAGAGERPAGATAPLVPEQAAIAGLTDGNRLKASVLAREAEGKLGLGDHEAGRRLLDKAVALDPDNARILAARSHARRSGKDFDGALEDADKAVRLDPMSAAALFARALARHELGWNPEIVLADLRSARRLDPRLLPELRKAAKRFGLAAFEGRDDPEASGATSGSQAGDGVGPNPAAKSISGGRSLAFGRPWSFLKTICAAVLSMIVIVGIGIVLKRKA